MEKKPGRCPKPEPLMDPGPAAQTPEAKRRKIKRHAGQIPDTAWPSQGQPKMVGKSKDASHCRSKKRPARKGRKHRRPRDRRGHPSRSPASHPHNDQSSSNELSTAPQSSTAPPATHHTKIHYISLHSTTLHYTTQHYNYNYTTTLH